EAVDGERGNSLSSERLRQQQDFPEMLYGEGDPPHPDNPEETSMNTKMKTLSMAVLGLVGFGAAGAAMAQCPASLSPPWSLVPTLLGTATSQTGRYDSSACRLLVALSQNTSAGAKGFALD